MEPFIMFLATNISFAKGKRKKEKKKKEKTSDIITIPFLPYDFDEVIYLEFE